MSNNVVFSPDQLERLIDARYIEPGYTVNHSPGTGPIFNSGGPLERAEPFIYVMGATPAGGFTVNKLVRVLDGKGSAIAVDTGGFQYYTEGEKLPIEEQLRCARNRDYRKKLGATSHPDPIKLTYLPNFESLLTYAEYPRETTPTITAHEREIFNRGPKSAQAPHLLDRKRITVGRSPNSTISVSPDNTFVSRTHLTIGHSIDTGLRRGDLNGITVTQGTVEEGHRQVEDGSRNRSGVTPNTYGSFLVQLSQLRGPLEIVGYRG